MTIVISISVQDGVVLASDSAVEHRGQVYYSAQKTMQLIRGMPIGVLVAGDGAIGNKAFIDVLKDFGAQAFMRGGNGGSGGLGRHAVTVEAVVRSLQDYLRSMAPMQIAKIRTTLIIAGYSVGSDSPEVWNLVFDSSDGISVSQVWSPSEYGISWEGSGECIHRLLSDEYTASNLPQDADDPSNRPVENSSPTLVTPGMPIHDAIDLTRFLMDTTIDYVRFRADLQPKTVGGPVDMAVITRHEGFRWVQRKRLSSSALHSAK
ncbi:MAG: hypothetical protein JWM36_1910 [Hyphomicrobiales bacterium]|nr:hypothetical protein [Hyphomicrobiales bacterium]